MRGGKSSRHSASGRGDAPSPDAPQFSQAAYSVAVEEASQARRGSGAYHGRDDRHPVPDASSGTNRNAEYIRRLEARNRAAAAAREAGLSVEQRELLRREKGFHVYMRGANEERVQEQAARASEVGHDSTKMRSRRRKSEYVCVVECVRGGVWAWWSVGVREPPCDVDAVLRQAWQKTASVRGTPHGSPVAHNASARWQP